MKINKVNKYGLKRDIHPDIRRKIRSDAGYGCVICGKIFVDYEHIEPEFKDAHEHDPEKMTLLCSGCHDDVTDKRISKKKVWLARENPFSKKNNLVKGMLDPETNYKNIKIGPLTSTGSSIFLKIYGKPVLWFSEPEDPEEPVGFNAIFNNENGILAFVERNVFYGVVAKHDIDTKASTIEIRLKKGKIALILKAEGDSPINIERFSINYLGKNVRFDKKGLAVNGVYNLSILDKDSSINFRVDEDKSGLCILSVLNVPGIKIHDGFGLIHPLEIAVTMIGKKKVISISGNIIGWVYNNFIISTSYYIIAKLYTDNNNKIIVMNVGDEFIGFLKESKSDYIVIYPDNRYESGEPIWVSNKNIKARNVFIRKESDLSHRLISESGGLINIYDMEI